jgi:(4-(4-[2-(gamma-L-glutamylamino)ethyl]phenoxymethyl)furan-2-yl)methanamine synthase
MPPDAVIGWDLGGAHLKAARLGREARPEQVIQVPCALWRGLDQLHAALDTATTRLGPAPLHALTMTGEMADLFPSREAGVRALIGEMGRRFDHADLRIFDGSASLCSTDEALAAPERVASANWLASALVTAQLRSDALFVDVGSTTSDVVVIRAGQVRFHGRDDASRLITGELVYSGVVRTPVLAMAERVPFGGEQVPLMAEWFATAADVYRLTGQLPEGADQHPAADGGDKSVAASARRLARMLGRDAGSAEPERWRELAEWLAAAEARRLRTAVERVLAREPLPPDAPLVVAGVGRFLLPPLARTLGRKLLEFGALLSVASEQVDRVSDCAPAVAVGWLAARESDRLRPPAGAAPFQRR